MRTPHLWIATTTGSMLRSLAVMSSLVVLLSGCSDRGCFGLCDARDDNDGFGDTATGIDTSCYTSGDIVAREEILTYADDPSGLQQVQFHDSSLASATNPRPVLIWVTGETWEDGTEIGNEPELALNIARELGAHFAAVSYRQSNTEDAAWPAQLLDVRTAIRFLKDQNDTQNFNLDLDQIYLGGDQAGANLAASVAYSNDIQEFMPTLFPNETDTPDLLITLGGIYNFESVLADNDNRDLSCANIEPNIDAVAIRSLFDCDAPADGAAELVECDIGELQNASPVFVLAGTGSPASLIYHGSLDCQIPIAQSDELDARFDGPAALRNLAIFNTLTEDTDALESLQSQDVLENLVGFAAFDCDPQT